MKTSISNKNSNSWNNSLWSTKFTQKTSIWKRRQDLRLDSKSETLPFSWKLAWFWLETSSICTRSSVIPLCITTRTIQQCWKSTWGNIKNILLSWPSYSETLFAQDTIKNSGSYSFYLWEFVDVVNFQCSMKFDRTESTIPARDCKTVSVRF